jgi:hypothetical protein
MSLRLVLGGSAGLVSLAAIRPNPETLNPKEVFNAYLWQELQTS